MLRASGSTGDQLWAKAAELERDFAGYKRRLAERSERRRCAAVDVGDGGGAGAEEEEEEERRDGGEGGGRGRRYQEYVRRRDERLRQEWRARMERKEAEVKALWARLDRAGSRRGGGDGEIASASHDRGQKPGSSEVKVKPTAPITPRCSPAAPATPRCSPAAKLTRPRTSVPPSQASASPRLSTPDARRRPSHLTHRHLPQAEPAATPRKENRLPAPPTSNAAAAAAATTPRPRTALARSRSMVKDLSFSSGRESPRPSRFQFQTPRTSCDGASNVKQAPLLPDRGTVVVEQSRPCFSEHATVLAQHKKARAVPPEPFHFGRSGDGATKPASSPQVPPKFERDSNEIANADCSADSNKWEKGCVDESAAKSGSPDIAGDSDTEPSYVYIKRDSVEEISQVSAGPGTRPRVELLTEDKDTSCNFEGAMASKDTNTIAGGSPMADAGEASSRRASSESLYSNVRSSFSQRSELDTSAANSPRRSPPSCTDPTPGDDAARPEKNPPEEEDAEKKKPGSSVSVSITVQAPTDPMAGLKRLLSFGKRNGKAGEVAAAGVECSPPAGDRSMYRGWSMGNSGKGRPGSSDSNAAASDDLDSSYVISPHVGSLQSFTPSTPANQELKEAVLHAKSPRVHKSFFWMSSFKSRTS